MKIAKHVALSFAAFIFTIAFTSQVYAQGQYYPDYRYNSATDALAASSALGVYGISGLIWIVCCCVIYIPFIILAVVVYNDAKKNNIDNGVLWAIVTLFLPLIGVLVYFFAIKPQALNTTANNAAKVTKKVEEKAEEKSE